MMIRTIQYVCFVVLIATFVQGHSGQNYDESTDDLSKAIRTIKSGDTYDQLIAEMEQLENGIITNFGSQLVWQYWKDAFGHRNNTECMLHLQKYAKVLKVLLEIGKATLPEGVRYSKLKLEELGKKLSAAIRSTGEESLSMKFDTELKRELVDGALKRAVLEPFKLRDNGYIEKPQNISHGLLRTLQMLQLFDKWINRNGSVLERKEFQDEYHRNDYARGFFLMFQYDELVETFKSERLAIRYVKDFGILTDSLKQSSSYKDYKSMFNRLARSQTLEAIELLLKEMYRVVTSPLAADKKIHLKEMFDDALQMVKLLLADGNNATTLEAYKMYFGILYKLQENCSTCAQEMGLADGRIRDTLYDHLVRESDLELYNNIIQSGEAELSKETLKELKVKDEKVYAISYLLNCVLEAVRHRIGLSTEVDNFAKSVLTMPNTLLFNFRRFFSSQEIKDAMAAAKAHVLESFNALSPEARQEIAERFPYRTLAAMSHITDPDDLR